MSGVIREFLQRVRANWRRYQEQRRDAVMFERAIVVTADEIGLHIDFPDGARQTMAWQDIRTCAIETNDSGPWGADVWWVFEDGTRRVAFPQGATGEAEMLRLLPVRFPGYDEMALISAMGCTDNARFVLWERDA